MRDLNISEMDHVAGGDYRLPHADSGGGDDLYKVGNYVPYNVLWGEDDSADSGMESSVEVEGEDPVVVVITANRGDTYSYGNLHHVSTYNPTSDLQWINFQLNMIHRDLNHNPGAKDINNGFWTAWDWTVDSLETAIRTLTGMASEEVDEYNREKLLAEKARLEEKKRSLEPRD